MHDSLFMKAATKTFSSQVLLVTTFLVAATNGGAFGEEKKYPYFNPDLTVAGNAAMNDARRVGLRWEALHGSSNKAAQEEFIAALATVMKTSLRGPYVYVPIPPCFELTYKNADLQKTVQSAAPSIPTIDDHRTDSVEKITRLGFFLAQREAQDGYCTAISNR